MIPFFRKIRYRLAKDNQFFKYSRYAIGEIVLVVIGILIALYINNWNEKRKEREKFDQILVEVEKELALNINEVRRLIQWAAKSEYGYVKILIDTPSIDHFTGNSRNSLLNASTNYNVASLVNDSFEKLSQTTDNSKAQESILNDLSVIYSGRNLGIDIMTKSMMEISRSNEIKIEKHPWYWSYLSGNVPDKVIQSYFLQDPEYINSAGQQWISIINLNGFLQLYDRDGRNVYNKIYSYLDSINLIHSDTLLFQYDYKDYKHYVGKYNSKWCSNKNYIHDDSIAVSLEEGKLIWNGYRSDELDTKLEIIPIDKYHFRDTRGAGMYHLEFNDQGDVNGIRYSQGPGFNLTIKKVR